MEVESTGSDNELKETLENTLQFMEPYDPDDTGTSYARIISINIESEVAQ